MVVSLRDHHTDRVLVEEEDGKETFHHTFLHFSHVCHIYTYHHTQTYRQRKSSWCLHLVCGGPVPPELVPRPVSQVLPVRLLWYLSNRPQHVSVNGQNPLSLQELHKHVAAVRTGHQQGTDLGRVSFPFFYKKN